MKPFIMSSEVETSLDISDSERVRDSSTPLGMTGS
jgi:hypothetical protein